MIYLCGAGTNFIDVLVREMDLLAPSPLLHASSKVEPPVLSLGKTLILPSHRGVIGFYDSLDDYQGLLPTITTIGELANHPILRGVKPPTILAPWLVQEVMETLVVEIFGPHHATSLAKTMLEALGEIYATHGYLKWEIEDSIDLRGVPIKSLPQEQKATFFRLLSNSWEDLLEAHGGVMEAKGRIQQVGTFLQQASDINHPLIVASHIGSTRSDRLLLEHVLTQPDCHGIFCVGAATDLGQAKAIIEKVTGIALHPYCQWINPPKSIYTNKAWWFANQHQPPALRKTQKDIGTDKKQLSWDPTHKIEMVAAQTLREEARVIALIVRYHRHYHPNQEITVITSNQQLVQMTKDILAAHGILVNDCLGVRLRSTMAGDFFAAIIEAMATLRGKIGEQIDLNRWAALLFHPLTQKGAFSPDVCATQGHSKRGEHLQQVRRWYQNTCRQSIIDRFTNPISLPGRHWIGQMQDDIWGSQSSYRYQSLGQWVTCHQGWAAMICGEASLLCQHQDGQEIEAIFEKLRINSLHYPSISFFEYCRLWNHSLDLGSKIRPPQSPSSLITMLSPLEGCYAKTDVTILADFNRGQFPQLNENPWLSPRLRTHLGLLSAEEFHHLQFGRLTHFLNTPQVYITRSLVVNDQPQEPSPFWRLIEAFGRATARDHMVKDHVATSDKASTSSSILKDGASKNDGSTLFVKGQWLEMVRPMSHLMDPSILSPSSMPLPQALLSTVKVPSHLMPKRLSVSGLQLLARDPYGFYIRYILGLYPTPQFARPPNDQDKGILLHHLLHQFQRLGAMEVGLSTSQILSIRDRVINQLFDALPKGFLNESWKAQALGVIDAVTKHIYDLYHDLENTLHWVTWSEHSGAMNLRLRVNDGQKMTTQTMGGGGTKEEVIDLEIWAIADLIIKKSDQLHLIDYKTGMLPTKKELDQGYYWQMPLEGLIALMGGFSNVTVESASDFVNLWFFKLSSRAPYLEATPLAVDDFVQWQDRLIDFLMPYYDKDDLFFPKTLQHGVCLGRSDPYKGLRRQ